MEKLYRLFCIKETMITIGVNNDEVKAFSSIYTRDFYGENVYRLLNRFLISDDAREDGGPKNVQRT